MSGEQEEGPRLLIETLSNREEVGGPSPLGAFRAEEDGMRTRVTLEDVMVEEGHVAGATVAEGMRLGDVELIQLMTVVRGLTPASGIINGAMVGIPEAARGGIDGDFI